MTRTTGMARVASGGACDKLFHIGTDDLRGLFGACRPRPRTVASSCGAFSFFRFSTKTSKTWRLRVGTAPPTCSIQSKENIDIGILRPKAGQAQAAEGSGKDRIETRVKTHKARGRRLPTFALPDKEFLASTATSKAACRRASDQGAIADWPYRARCLPSCAGQDRRQRSGYN